MSVKVDSNCIVRFQVKPFSSAELFGSWGPELFGSGGPAKEVLVHSKHSNRSIRKPAK